VLRHSLALKVAGQINYLSFNKITLAHVFGVEQHDTTLVVDTTIAIFKTVDCGVELIGSLIVIITNCPGAS